MVDLDRILFHLVDKKVIAGCVSQVVVWYSKGCMQTALGRLNFGSLRQVFVLIEVAILAGSTA